MSPVSESPARKETHVQSGVGGHLVLVSGPGRSGTSAITGALSELGVHVPPPLVEPNRSNPRGFFETRWVVEFHKSILARASTYEFDPDPAAVDRVQKVVDGRTRRELTDWLKRAVDVDAQQFAVKDPRTVWLHDLWADVAAENAMTTSYLTTLRHPAEVVGSRERYYGRNRDADRARAYAINKVAGWINVSLLNERQTRPNRRVFIRYTDLVANWRSVMQSVQNSLGLEFAAGLGGADAHPIDSFIAPTLHHVRTTWDDLDVPKDLRTIADAVWAASEQLADKGADDALEAEFDQLSEQYAKLFTAAAAMTSDLRLTAVQDALAKAEAVAPPARSPLRCRPRSIPPGGTSSVSPGRSSGGCRETESSHDGRLAARDDRGRSAAGRRLAGEAARRPVVARSARPGPGAGEVPAQTGGGRTDVHAHRSG